MPGTAYQPASLAPETDDSETVLARKIGAQLFNNATGTLPTATVMVDDDLKACLYKICALLDACAQGTAEITAPS